MTMTKYALLISLYISISSLIVSLSALNLNSSETLHWAVLVAGSNSYSNYRHQADICHSYKILIGNGMNPDRIITLLYDDIAYNTQNPFQGQIFNKPDATGDGVDVYKNCKIDYKGNDVSPQTFLDVLNGKEISYGSKKTLKSSSLDNIFVYYSGIEV